MFLYAFISINLIYYTLHDYYLKLSVWEIAKYVLSNKSIMPINMHVNVSEVK